MTGVEVEAVIEKSTTFAVCELVPCVPPPFALTLPETEIVGLWAVMDGVTSTSTDLRGDVHKGSMPAASVGITHSMVFPLGVPKDPEPLVTLAVALAATAPPIGTTARKVTSDALSG